MFLTVITFFLIIIVFLSVNNKHLKERMIINNIFNEVKLQYNPDKSYLNKDSVYFAHYSTAYQIFQKNKFFELG